MRSPVDLFSAARAVARRTDHTSSHAAADRATASGLVAGHEARIHDALVERGGQMTAQQIAAATGLEHVQVARRLAGMKKRGLVDCEKPPGGRIEWWARR